MSIPTLAERLDLIFRALRFEFMFRLDKIVRRFGHRIYMNCGRCGGTVPMDMKAMERHVESCRSERRMGDDD